MNLFGNRAVDSPPEATSQADGSMDRSMGDSPRPLSGKGRVAPYEALKNLDRQLLLFSMHFTPKTSNSD